MQDPEQRTDPFEPGYGGYFADPVSDGDGDYSLVVRRVPQSRLMKLLSGPMFKKAVISECPKCHAEIAVFDTVRWRDYGTSLMCNVCAKRWPGAIVANDTLEIIPLDPTSGMLQLPKRFSERREHGERERSVRLDELRKELPLLDKYVSEHADSEWALINRAKVLAKIGDSDTLHENLSDLDKAVRLAPEDVRVVGWRATLLSIISVPYPDVKQQIVQDWKRVIELDPDCADAYWRLAIDDPDSAQQILRDACKRFPEHKLLQKFCSSFGIDKAAPQ